LAREVFGLPFHRATFNFLLWNLDFSFSAFDIMFSLAREVLGPWNLFRIPAGLLHRAAFQLSNFRFQSGQMPALLCFRPLLHSLNLGHEFRKI
jgi:hypothetical protein